MKLKDTGLTFQDIKDKVNKYMIDLISLQRQQRACTFMMRIKLHILIFMLVLQ